jgi:UDP-3-O-[3-hydroxymyristoyl] glucosamine N-acyltransferase
MEFTADQIAEFLNGSIEGKKEVKVTSISRIEEGKPGTLSFLANPLYTKYIYDTQASIVLVNRDFVPERSVNATMIRVDDAYSAFAKLLQLYNEYKYRKVGVDKKAIISETASIGEDCYIGANVIISEHVKIGKNVKIYPNVYIGDNVEVDDNTIIRQGVNIYEDTKIGKHCIFHSGVVIGSDGFGFAPQDNNEFSKVPQIGNVIIEDHVEIGANTTIDRATIGSTVIRKRVKLDNLVQVAHNVEIGENTVVVAQTGISGSTKIGKNCMIGGQVGIVGHIEIADGVKIAAQSGIGASIKEENKLVQGSPAFDVGAYRRSYVCFKNLPEMNKSINEIKKKVLD